MIGEPDPTVQICGIVATGFPADFNCRAVAIDRCEFRRNMPPVLIRYETL